MVKTSFKIQVEKEALSGLIFSKQKNTKANCIFLHGAGGSNKSRYEGIAKTLAQQGHATLAFDFSGHGESSGKLEDSSLAQRVSEAKAVISEFGNLENLTLVGASMSGYIALKLLKDVPVQNLILFCPALYDAQSYHIQFGNGFTDIIRTSNSWKRSDAQNNLKDFKGKLLIIIGEEDEVIPEGVVDLIMDSALIATKKDLIKIPNCTHQIMHYLNDNPEIRTHIADKILEHIQ